MPIFGRYVGRAVILFIFLSAGIGCGREAEEIATSTPLSQPTGEIEPKATSTPLSQPTGEIEPTAIMAKEIATSTPPSQPTGEIEPEATMNDLSIRVLDAYFWRDWMPEVEQPGADGGSPLFGTITVQVENRGEQAQLLDYRVALVNEEGRTEPVAFQVEPGVDGQPWDGTLAPGENRTITLITEEGPYFPAGSKVLAHVTWSDAQNNSVTVTTPVIEIMVTS